VKMLSPTDFHLSSRPLGPRDMPPPPPGPPPHPPKLPLNTQITASMPKEPSPTYSPARNLSTPASIPPPRSTARSIVGTGGRSNSMAASSVSSHPPSTNGETDSYLTNSSNTSQTTASSRRKSIHMPLELQISAEKLFDYIVMYNILLIDVRNREEFDEGHIYVNSIICVEPTALEDGYSAEQLTDRLVLSPDEEQTMFDRRDQYDLVVYYDQSTTSVDFRSKPNRNGSEIALQRLFDTLYEFNSEKPLQRPPILLMGGIDAWTRLLGSTSLKTSTTAAAYAAGYAKPSRAIGRVPVASNAARLNLQRRRFRDYAPMDAEEERKWLEEARRERPMLKGENEDVSPIYRTTEDFILRYPDPSEIEQQSMIYPPSRPPVPNAYVAPAIPSAPSRPPPSVPRMSYGGVHERQITPHGRTFQLPAYVSPNHHPQNRLPRTGLINFGVTCYMNSTIQCLNATIPLTGIFLSNQYLKEIQRDNWKGSKGLMSENYATLIQNLWKNDVTSVRPSSLRVSSILPLIPSTIGPTSNSVPLTTSHLTPSYRDYALASTPNGAWTGNKMLKSFLNFSSTSCTKTSTQHGLNHLFASLPRPMNKLASASLELTPQKLNGAVIHTAKNLSSATSLRANTPHAYIARRVGILVQPMKLFGASALKFPVTGQQI